ncbi:MAG: outer membrane protein transport protein, partial [Gallionellaceae bacterium]|nr:outer membrane protein transport protein [Gallionellaceae bacterium]
NPGSGPYNLLCGNGRLGVDMMQLIVAPTVSYKINETNSIGISPLLGYQRFKAEGLQAFSGFSADANNLTNKGYDSATGYGVRIGWLGKVNDAISLGAAYSTKINYSKFDKYKGLFAEEGGFDTPVNWNLGIAIKATPTLLLAVDYQQIDYSGINSIGNASNISGATIASTLGPSNGRGFGWEDAKIVKLGAEYTYNSGLILRAGYSHTSNPITSRDVTFNIIAPGVIEDHYTLGFTYTLANKSEITMAFMHAKNNSVTGSSLFNTWTTNTSGTERIRMHQNSLGIAYGWKM